MKVCLKYKKKLFQKYQLDIIIDFINLLQKKLPVNGEITIYFLSERKGGMTTGSFLNKNNSIKILAKNRMLSDILRTLSHEWAHCYDRQHLNITDRRDIGGESENFANAKSGEITKLYIKSNKHKEDKIFE